MRDGRRNGIGVYTTTEGNRYEGEYHNGVAHGRGVKTWASGARYEGEFRNGREHGIGIYIYANGNRYEGEFRDGKRDGTGTYTSTNGDRYEGEVRNGKPNGRGVTTWASGAHYEGEFHEGMQEGRGAYTDDHGNRYEGVFLDNQPDGNGALFLSTGEIIEGPWIAGCLYAGARVFAFRRPLQECQLEISNEDYRREHGLLSKWSKYAAFSMVFDSNAELYSDQATVKRHGKFVRVSELQNLKNPGGANELSRRIVAEYDCANERFRFLLVAAYSGQMAHGTVLGVMKIPPEWHSIQPGSVLADRRRKLCQ